MQVVAEVATLGSTLDLPRDLTCSPDPPLTPIAPTISPFSAVC